MNIIITGACGRMGNAVAAAAVKAGINIAAGIDVNMTSAPLSVKYPIYERLCDFDGDADCIVDFSHHSALEGILEYALSRRLAVVIATTGHTEAELAMMAAASKSIPVFFSRNMSLGVNLLLELVRRTAESLGKAYNIEIVEEHHMHKLDAPSGTALMLADSAAAGLRAAEGDEFRVEYITDRSERRTERPENEIGIHSVRGGNIVGEHEVIFAAQNEVIRLSHSAASREVFADGAIRAVQYIVGKPAGMYDMHDVITAV